MAIRRATPLTISFAAVDSSLRPTRKSGLSFGSGDTKISKDGGSTSNTTNNPAEIGSTGRYQVTLTAAEMNASWIHIYAEKTGMDPVDLTVATNADPSASVQTDGGNSASSFKTDRSEATTDYWKNCLLLFTSGSLAGQVQKVSGYDGTTKIVTVSNAFTGTPSNGDLFIFINI